MVNLRPEVGGTVRSFCPKAVFESLLFYLLKSERPIFFGIHCTVPKYDGKSIITPKACIVSKIWNPKVARLFNKRFTNSVFKG